MSEKSEARAVAEAALKAAEVAARLTRMQATRPAWRRTSSPCSSAAPGLPVRWRRQRERTRGRAARASRSARRAGRRRDRRTHRLIAWIEEALRVEGVPPAAAKPLALDAITIGMVKRLGVAWTKVGLKEHCVVLGERQLQQLGSVKLVTPVCVMREEQLTRLDCC